MTNYKEILRLHSLGINNTRIAESCGCARSTVIAALQRAAEQELSWNKIKNCSTEEVARKLYPSTALGQQYKMPDYEWVHREMQKSGVTLSLLWVEYCEQCRQSGELPYKSTQLPDICSQVENSVMDGNRILYINWFNSHVEYDDFHFPMPGFETQTFDGEMCYSLRCKVLHNGNTEVTNPKLKVLVDSFELLKPGEANYRPGYTYIEKHLTDGTTKIITCIAIDYLSERLCDMAEKFYNAWPNKQDFEAHKIWNK